MKSKTILFRDPVVERVCDKFVKRSDVGYAKYGRTLHNERTGKHKDLAGYLNDVQEGGETEFLYQKTRFKPKRNMGLLWPGSFTHTHRGNPPLSETKYVLTGWITSVGGNSIVDLDLH